MKTTEQDSRYNHIENMSTIQILTAINDEDKKVAIEVEKILPAIEAFIDQAYLRLRENGRLFYIGAGTSGRLGILDASECPPTFGVSHDKVVGIIAGGDGAIRKAVEFAEDNKEQAWIDLATYNITQNDVLVGIAASGSTPYVLGGIAKANEHGILTGCIVCNKNSELGKISTHEMSVDLGPEFISGSTRMKSGTAQKLILNMISTSLMVKLGKVKGNKMIDMQLSNDKLVERGILMLMNELGVTKEKADHLLKEFGGVRNAINNFKSL